MVDYYNLLGVPPTASNREIQAAFRRRAKTVHPDAYPGLEGEEKRAVERRFIQLAQAYETLADPERRAAFDRKWRTTQGAGRGRRPASSAGGAATHGPRSATGATGAGSGTGPRQASPFEGPEVDFPVEPAHCFNTDEIFVGLEKQDVRMIAGCRLHTGRTFSAQLSSLRILTTGQGSQAQSKCLFSDAFGTREKACLGKPTSTQGCNYSVIANKVSQSH